MMEWPECAFALGGIGKAVGHRTTHKSSAHELSLLCKSVAVNFASASPSFPARTKSLILMSSGVVPSSSASLSVHITAASDVKVLVESSTIVLLDKSSPRIAMSLVVGDSPEVSSMKVGQ